MSDESHATESAEILKLYKGLRLTDVGDALDYMGLMDTCIMDWEIRPLWRDGVDFKHRLYGVAHTARFVPTKMVVTPPKEFDEYRQWAGRWYRDQAPGPLGPFEENSILIIDGAQTKQCGYIGSNNAQQWMNKGAIGIVTDGGCRDTDELILQNIPVYHKRFSRGIRPRRVELDGENIPVTCGGVHVCPGDIILADNDGVVVVPREHAREVAKYATVEANCDKVTRRRLYEEAGMTPDFTLEDV